MALTAEQLRIAAGIDAAMQKLARAGQDDVTIFAGMAGHMADFKRLMDTAGQNDMNELGRRFAGFLRYAKILEMIAAGIQSGALKVPR
jgi:hypothetical protein